MTGAARELAIEDVRKVITLTAEESDAGAIYLLVERLARETCGYRLLTVLRYVEAAAAVERVHSSDLKAYPVGGRKPLDKIQDTHRAMAGGEVFLAATRAEVQKAYFDHELIFSLGITAILNAPIRHAGRRLGTLNLCGEEGMYDAAAVAKARVLAGLLVPVLMRPQD
jgi:hypothetical protein